MFNSHRPLLANQQNGSNDTAQWKSAIPSVQKVHSNDKRSKRIVPVTENFPNLLKNSKLKPKVGLTYRASFLNFVVCRDVALVVVCVLE